MVFCVWLFTHSMFPEFICVVVCISTSFLFFFSFIYLWLHWVFIAARGLSLVAASGGYSSLSCAGFSLRWLLLVQSTGSSRTGFSSCCSWALLLCGMWDLPGPGIEPVFPALAGGFLTTVPPGKPSFLFIDKLHSTIWIYHILFTHS